MKKIIFLGYVITPKEANVMSGASIAGNKMQWNVVKNLSRMNDVEITCVTISPRASFPNDKKLFEKSSIKQLFPKVKSYNVPYCNIPVLKQFSQTIFVYFFTKKLIKELDADTLFCFNLFPQVGIPMRWLKKKFQNIETICLLADLPIDDNTKRKGISVWLRACMENSTWKSMRACDKYIVLNKYVMEKYLPEKPFIVVDGGIDESDVERYENIVPKTKEHNILFCGALTEYNGILVLLQTMELLKYTDIVLDIYGGGYLEAEVIKATKRNQKIHFYGKVSNAEVVQKQREAWLLINPRITHDPIALVTFPSKIFEYLLSGTPVISSYLNGYGEEYNNHIIFVDGERPEDYANKIIQILHEDEIKLSEFGQNARLFVQNEKSWYKQTKRICQFLIG